MSSRKGGVQFEACKTRVHNLRPNIKVVIKCICVYLNVLLARILHAFCMESWFFFSYAKKSGHSPWNTSS